MTGNREPELRIYRDLESACGKEAGCVLAIGNYDGIHLGHQDVFRVACDTAKSTGSPLAVLTFAEHTAAMVRPDSVPPVLMDVNDRLMLMEELGIEAALVLPFDDTLASLKPDQFVDRILSGCLGVSRVVAGTDWRFGQGRSGDVEMLEELGQNHGFSVIKVDPFVVEGKAVSSTRIREALSTGNVDLAARLLGRPHFVKGRVQSGEGKGREIGFPTVNLDCGKIMLPSGGVYSASYGHKGRSGAAAVNIGVRPTFGGSDSTVEAHLVGVDGDLYGADIRLNFLSRLRDEITFADVNSLSEQIARDVEETVRIYRAVFPEDSQYG